MCYKLTVQVGKEQSSRIHAEFLQCANTLLSFPKLMRFNFQKYTYIITLDMGPLISLRNASLVPINMAANQTLLRHINSLGVAFVHAKPGFSGSPGLLASWTGSEEAAKFWLGAWCQ